MRQCLILWLAIFAAVLFTDHYALSQRVARIHDANKGQLQDELTQTLRNCGRPRRDYTFPPEQSTEGKLTRFLSYRQGTLWFWQQPRGWTYAGVSRDENSPVDLTRPAASVLLPCFLKVQTLTPNAEEATGPTTRISNDKQPAPESTVLIWTVFLILGAVLVFVLIMRMTRRKEESLEAVTQQAETGLQTKLSTLDVDHFRADISSGTATVKAEMSSIQSSEVELYTGGLERDYRSLGVIEAKRSKRSALSQDPTLDEVNSELRQKAAGLGANAVLSVNYKRTMSLTSYGVLIARGEAVFIVSDTRLCPICAEAVKSAAVKCRFCGAELQT